MNKLVIALITVAALLYIFMKRYTEENGRFAPISTPRGKEARLVCVPLIAVLIGLLVATISSGQGDPTLFNAMIYASIVGVLVAIVGAYWQKRKK